MRERVVYIIALLLVVVIGVGHSRSFKDYVWYTLVVGEDAIAHPNRERDALRILEGSATDTEVSVSWDTDKRAVELGLECVGEDANDVLTCDGSGGTSWAAGGAGATGPTGPTGPSGPTGPTSSSDSSVALSFRDSLAITNVPASWTEVPYSDFVWPGISNFASETHTVYFRYCRTGGSGSCDIRIYNVTGTAAVCTLSGITSADCTVLSDCGTVTEPASWAACRVEAQSSDGSTSCQYDGMTWLVEE